MRLIVLYCLLLASVAVAYPNGRHKRHLAYLKNLITSALFGRSQINIQPPAPVPQEEVRYKLFRVPGFEDIIIKITPKKHAVNEFVYPPAAEKVNLNAFGKVVGTNSNDDTVVAVKGVNNLLSTGILYGGHNNVMKENMVPMFPFINFDNYVVEEKIKSAPVIQIRSALIEEVEKRPVFTEVIESRPVFKELTQSGPDLTEVFKEVIETKPLFTQVIETKPVFKEVIETGPVLKEVIETEPVLKEVIETGPVLTEVVETKPVLKEVIETGPVLKEVIETEPVLKEVIETGPVLTEVIETKPVLKEVIETGPVLTEIIETGPVLTEIIESGPVLTEVIETEPVLKEVIETGPVLTEVIETEPVLKEVIETGPVHTEVIESEPVLTEVIETEPVMKEVIETKPILKEVIETGPVHTEIIETGPVLTEVNETGPVLTEVIETVPVMKEVIATKQVLKEVIETGPVLTEIIETGPVLTEIIETGPVLTEIIETGPVLTEFNETGPVLTEVIETVPVMKEVIATKQVLKEVIETGPVLTEIIETGPVHTEVIESEPVLTEVIETEPVMKEVIETGPVLTEVFRPVEERVELKVPFEPTYAYKQMKNNEPEMTFTAHTNPGVEVLETINMTTELPMCIKERDDEAILLGSDPTRFAPMQDMFQYQNTPVFEWPYPTVETDSNAQDQLRGKVLTEEFDAVSGFGFPLQRFAPDRPVRYNLRPTKTKAVNPRPIPLHSHKTLHFEEADTATKENINNNSETEKLAFTNLSDKVHISDTLGPIPPQYITNAVSDEDTKQREAVPIVDSIDNVSNAKIPSNVYKLQENPNTGEPIKENSVLRTNVKTNTNPSAISLVVDPKMDDTQERNVVYTNKVTAKPRTSRPVVVPSVNTPIISSLRQFVQNPAINKNVNDYTYQQKNADGSSLNVNGNQNGVFVNVIDNNTGRGDIPD